MTANLEGVRHAQSYFLVVPGSTLRSRLFSMFWTRMTPLGDKLAVISRYEGGHEFEGHRLGRDD